MRWGSPRLFVASAIVLAASGVARAEAPERLESSASAGIETVLPLGPRVGCVDLALRGSPSASFRLDVFDSVGDAQMPTASGFGGVRARVCPGSRHALHAVIVSSADGDVNLEVRSTDGDVPQPIEADVATARAELGPAASFTASRRLAARVDRAQEHGLSVSQPPFDVRFDAARSFELSPPDGRACALLMVEVDEGRLEFEGGSSLEAGRGASQILCGESRVRGRSMDGAPRARAVWLVAEARPTSASSPETFLLDAALAARGMTGRTLANVMPGSSSVPVAIRSEASGCFAIAAQSRAAVELTLTDDRGAFLARSVSADPHPLVWHCVESASTTIAWVRSSSADDPVRLVLAREVPR